jgi:hypothetical protein
MVSVIVKRVAFITVVLAFPVMFTVLPTFASVMGAPVSFV